MSIYPNAIDGFEQLPLAIDGVTKVNAYSINNLRQAILNIEKELGISPSSYYASVRERLDALETTDGSPLDIRLTQVENALVELENKFGDYLGEHSSLEARLSYIESLIPDEPLYLITGDEILKGNLLRINNLGKVKLAYSNVGSDDPDDIKKARVVGSVSKQYSDGQSARIYATVGSLIDVRFLSAPSSSDNGELVYLSDTPGYGTLEIPTSSGSVVFSIGVLQGANGISIAPKVVFQPKLEYFIS